VWVLWLKAGIAFCTSPTVCINLSLCGYCYMGFSDIVVLRYNSGIAYVNIFNDGRLESSMWVLPKFVIVYWNGNSKSQH